MAGSVKAIDKQSVHRICSGQVVLNLATAVKELVENALDAGATNIDIRLKEYGSEILEVADNASGVEEDNFQGLTLKHHTSKLRDFSDLSSVDTFGFRGEALSSLCALSDMTVVTCHKTASVGRRLEYDHNGRLARQTPSPRQHGTTVSLQNLFSTLPVRHKEFLRNLKKEFTRMVQLLQAYGIISSGVKLTCSNQVGQGKRSPVLTTSGNTLLKENIANVFGPKQLQSLLEFSQLSPNAEQCEEYGLTEQQLQDQLFRLTGYISKSDHGQGRGSSDRQYLYINRRPCDFPKVSKLINEVYHMYNRHQYPFVVLDISLAKDSVDVNVTPDKRKIFVLEEKSLLAVLKASLLAMFEPRSALYDVNSQMKSSLATTNAKTSTGGTLSSFPRPTLSNGTSTEDCKPDYKGLKVTLAGLKRSFSHTGSSSVNNKLEEESRAAKQPRLDFYLLKRSNTEPKNLTTDHLTSTPENPKSTNGRLLPGITENRSLQKELKSGTLDRDDKVYCSDERTEDVGSEPNIVRTKETNEFTSANDASKSSLDGVNGVDSEKLSEQNGPFEVAANCARDQGSDSQSEAINLTGNSLKDQSQVSGDELSSSHVSSSSHKSSSCHESTDQSRTHDGVLKNCGEDSLEDSTVSVVPTRDQEHDIETKKCRETAHSEKQGLQTVLTIDDSSFEHNTSKKEVIVPFSFQGISERLKETEIPGCGPKVLSRTFKATITPSENSTAEEELKKHVCKDMFPSMEILGQFNLGFIIAKHNRDLFIIDQHATDEKYNFEMLQRHTALQGQKLIQPMQLELTAVSESILIDNLEIFKKNGFDFTVDEDAPPTRRVKLVSVPVSKNWTFGKDDIDEVIFMLSDCPGVMCRPTRVRQMFASRACRKSIMIGTALDKREMRKVLNHMAEIDQPWNCPHGRPTMRHLFNLDMLPD